MFHEEKMHALYIKLQHHTEQLAKTKRELELSRVFFSLMIDLRRIELNSIEDRQVVTKRIKFEQFMYDFYVRRRREQDCELQFVASLQRVPICILALSFVHVSSGSESDSSLGSGKTTIWTAWRKLF